MIPIPTPSSGEYPPYEGGAPITPNGLAKPSYDHEFWEALWSKTLREQADKVKSRPANGWRRSKVVESRWNVLELVSMTRTSKRSAKRAKPGAKLVARAGSWIFQDAKARLSEVVRRARSEGPQHVTVHGRAGVVVVAEEEFRRLKGDVTGAALIAALQASPYREVELAPKRGRMPVRDVGLP